MVKKYVVPKKNHAGEYTTDSIVAARAYAAKMIREDEHGWTWWDIYTTEKNLKGLQKQKPYTTVVYSDREYKWHHFGKISYMYSNGKLKKR